MSMHITNYTDYGLYLSEKDCRYIANVFRGKKPQNIDDIDDALESIDAIVTVGNFTGEITKIDSEGVLDETNSITIDSDSIAYVPTSKIPNFFSQAYLSIDELAEELNNKIGRYLPKHFDYVNSIVEIKGTIYD